LETTTLPRSSNPAVLRDPQESNNESGTAHSLAPSLTGVGVLQANIPAIHSFVAARKALSPAKSFLSHLDAALISMAMQRFFTSIRDAG
jgi:hypothetical protein